MSSTFNPPNDHGHRNAPFRVEPASARSQPDLQRQLDAVWKQSRPIILDRFRRLDAFIQAVEDGSSTPEQMEDATTIAHSFAGSLGMFGYPEGTELARSMEHWLGTTTTPNPVTLRDYATGLRTILGL